ncbi:MAG: heavy-metal-associated domain-containing protein [Sulfurovum sp.]|nr:heavy-metal-associated domain-containing protein [Sulfurovum sp.]
MRIFFLGYLFCIVGLWGAERTVIIDIKGMTCPLCTTVIKKSLKQEPGVHKAKVRLNTAKATVTYDDTQTSPEKLLQAIARTGYEGKISYKN